MGENQEREKIECPKCGSSIIVTNKEQGLLVCRNCGRILEEKMMDGGPEWRAYNQEEWGERSRIGIPSTQTIHDKGLTTEIGWGNRDSSGKTLTSKQKSKMHRLRGWQSRMRISGENERNLAYALSEISRMSSLLGLTRAAQEAASEIYRKAMKKGLVRGRTIEGIASAAVYTACRELNIPRSLEEIAEVSHIDKKKIARNRKLLTKELDIRLPLADPINYISKFGTKLKTSGETSAKAIDIIRKAQEKGIIAGTKAEVVAATAIYIACMLTGDKRTQDEISEISNVSKVTLRKRYKELAKQLNLVLDV